MKNKEKAMTRRFTVIRKGFDVKMIITDENKKAKIPLEYQRCGLSYLGLFDKSIESQFECIYQ